MQVRSIDQVSFSDRPWDRIDRQPSCDVSEGLPLTIEKIHIVEEHLIALRRDHEQGEPVEQLGERVHLDHVCYQCDLDGPVVGRTSVYPFSVNVGCRRDDRPQWWRGGRRERVMRWREMNGGKEKKHSVEKKKRNDKCHERTIRSRSDQIHRARLTHTRAGAMNIVILYDTTGIAVPPAAFPPCSAARPRNTP